MYPTPTFCLAIYNAPLPIPSTLRKNIFWSSTTLRNSPRNILRGDLNITSLTMNTILRINLKPLPQLLSVIIQILVHPRGAKPRLDPLPRGETIFGMFIPVGDDEVRGLIFFVVGTCAGDGGEEVKGELAIWFGVIDWFIF